MIPVAVGTIGRSLLTGVSALVSRLAPAVIPKVSSAVSGVSRKLISNAEPIVKWALPGYLTGRAVSEVQERTGSDSPLDAAFDAPGRAFSWLTSEMGKLVLIGGLIYVLLNRGDEEGITL